MHENDPNREEEQPQEEEEHEEEQPELDEAEKEPEPLAALEHWPQRTKKIFEGAAPEIQQYILDREKEFDRGFQEKNVAVQQIQSQLDRYESIIGPIRTQLQLQGMDEVAWMSQMAAYTTALANDPLGVIQAVAKQYGVDLTQIGQSDEFTDPGIRSL